MITGQEIRELLTKYMKGKLDNDSLADEINSIIADKDNTIEVIPLSRHKEEMDSLKMEIKSLKVSIGALKNRLKTDRMNRKYKDMKKKANTLRVNLKWYKERNLRLHKEIKKLKGIT